MHDGLMCRADFAVRVFHRPPAAITMSLYIEARIRAPMEVLWRHTQDPALHEQWDARFTEIRYLPRPDPAEPQRFHYATRIGFGIAIRGEGESVGEAARPDGVRTSALKFRSDDRKSLIREGSGFWQYVPTDDGIRFLTRYDYHVRFGIAGRLFDRLIFRPLMGWATAWSFDRLRLWLERGLHPAVAMERSLVYAVLRIAVAFVWLWHGLMPKLIFRDPLEVSMVTDAGVGEAAAEWIARAAGWAEAAMAVVMIRWWNARWPAWTTILLMTTAVAGLAVNSPVLFTRAFNPLTLNLLMTAACAAMLCVGERPAARRCLRRPPDPS